MNKVCVSCGNDIQATDRKGNRVCPICGGYAFKEVEVNKKTAKCCYCGRSGKDFKDLPFYNEKTNTFYCGCRGWD